jgi:hypothetical protein
MILFHSGCPPHPEWGIFLFILPNIPIQHNLEITEISTLENGPIQLTTMNASSIENGFTEIGLV